MNNLPRLLQRLALYSLLTFLVSGLNACNKEEEIPPVERLLLAAESGQTTILSGLLSDGVEIDSRDNCQFTPLMKAAMNGHTDSVIYLLDSGANPNLTDKGGYSPLMLAASNNHIDITRLLLSSGADINLAEQTKGWTALIWSSINGHENIIRLLLENDADRLIKDLSGKTAADWISESRPSLIDICHSR